MVKKLKHPADNELLPDASEQGDYEVGFKKPPKATRFTKGQSGNPSGRPKGKKNMASILLAAANELVSIHENGRTRQVTKFEAACKQVLNKSANGDLHAMRLVVQLMPSAEAQMLKGSTAVLSDERDLMIVQELLKRAQGVGHEED